MSKLNWKRREYETWDEAFRGLAPAVRQQSVRVAAYTQALFQQACKTPFGSGNDYETRIRGQYSDVAYKCGMYHQLGKALVPPEYQIEQRDFTEEERAVYRKYTTDGAQLVIVLQERANRAKERRFGRRTKPDLQNVPGMMIRESCQQHMERWDGSGYPEGRKGNEISPIAQIVGLAKELDRRSAETKSENPFDEAYAELIGESGTIWSPELIAVLQAAQERCREIYEKYICYTMTVPKTVPLVVKRPQRPFGLQYRPMVGLEEGKAVAYEAIPWFHLAEEGNPVSAEDQADMLQRTNLVADVMFYLLYEAADTLYRLQNCKLDTAGILVETIPGFFQLSSQLQRFLKLFEEQPVPKEKLMLLIPAETVMNAGKGVTEVFTRYLRNGICLVVDQYRPNALPMERLKELGFTHVRLAEDLYLQKTTANAMYELKKAGFTLIGGGADAPELLKWQLESGIAFTGGTMTGVPTDEDELIRDALMKERLNYGA